MLIEPEEHGPGPRMEAVYHSACSTWTMDGGSASFSMQHMDHGWRQCITQHAAHGPWMEAVHHSVHGLRNGWGQSSSFNTWTMKNGQDDGVLDTSITA